MENTQVATSAPSQAVQQHSKDTSLNHAANGTQSKPGTNSIAESIGTILRQFLRDAGIGLPLRNAEYDDAFAEACQTEAFRLGFQEVDILSPMFQLSLRHAVIMTTEMYDQHDNIFTRYWLTLYNTCFLCFDNLAEKNVAPFASFSTLFTSGGTQKLQLLDDFARLLRLRTEHFPDPSSSNLILTSSLDFFTGLVLESKLKGKPIHESAIDFPRYYRTLTGDGAAYSIFAFPPTIPLQDYIQLMPNLVDWINESNDLFSFYKEELVSDDTNRISVSASVTGKTKLECLKELADQCVENVQRMRRVLASQNADALFVLEKCVLRGYLLFHTGSTERYRLGDLNLN